MIGTMITHHRITARLGQGGMGAEYRAADATLERRARMN